MEINFSKDKYYRSRIKDIGYMNHKLSERVFLRSHFMPLLLLDADDLIRIQIHLIDHIYFGPCSFSVTSK